MNQMTERDALYLGALLHDIGKFIERAKNDEWKKKAEQYVQDNQAIRSYAHKRYSAAFVKTYAQQFGFSSAVEEYILRHHPDKGLADAAVYDQIPEIQLLRLADQFASAEREEDASLKPNEYYKARLQSPFWDIALEGERASERTYQGLEALNTQRSNVFASTSSPTLPDNAYADALNQFLQEVSKVPKRYTL
jgi:CRISPR-associated protein Csm1